MAIDVIGAKLGSVMILDQDKNELYIGASCGLEDNVVQTTRMKLGSSISGYVAQTGRPLIIEDIEKDPRFARINRQKYESKSLISVPSGLQGPDYSELSISITNSMVSRSPKMTFHMLTSLGLPAAVAIDRANLIAEKTRTISELRVST